ncbi:MAG: hypothetical protein C4290_05070 [Chloroflexota bacterium]
MVEVDQETGEVKLLRFDGVDDCGPVINPLLVAGQVQGGIAQGVGQALMEEVVAQGLACYSGGAARLASWRVPGGTWARR